MKFALGVLLCLLTFNIPYTATPPKLNFTEKDVKCLALNIHHEARGESIKGQKAVAHVTVNRTKSNKFPNSICKVVYQRGQFSWVGVKSKQVKVSPEIVQLSINVLAGKYEDVTKGALYFHNTSIPSRKSSNIRIGSHIFYS